MNFQNNLSFEQLRWQALQAGTSTDTPVSIPDDGHFDLSSFNLRSAPANVDLVSQRITLTLRVAHSNTSINAKTHIPGSRRGR